LARAGVVCLRVELPGVGGSAGGPCPRLELSELEAVFARAYDTLAGTSGVAVDRIVLLGHSLGAVLAARLAAQRPVAALVAAGVSPSSWGEYVVRTTRRQLERRGLPYPMVERLVRLEARFVHHLLVDGLSPAQIAERDPHLERYLKDTRRTSDRSWGHGVALFQQLDRVNQAALWASVPAPVLAIWGERDEVTEREDHERLVAIVNQAHPGSASLSVLPGVDHALRHPGPPLSAASAPGAGGDRYSPSVHRAVLAWLRAQRVLDPPP